MTRYAETEGIEFSSHCVGQGAGYQDAGRPSGGVLTQDPGCEARWRQLTTIILPDQPGSFNGTVMVGTISLVESQIACSSVVCDGDGYIRVPLG